MKNQVQLIAYADRLGEEGLPGLARLLAGPLAGLFGGVHVLPFFDPIDGADAGFDPIDHTRVDPRLGTWTDLRELSATVDVMADLIVNHVSTRSGPFLDFVRQGAASPYAGMFLTLGRVFPRGARESDLVRIHRPRPTLPFTAVTVGSAERRLLWTTFTSEQADIDVTHPRGRAYLREVLDVLARGGVSMVRLDAIGFAIKRAGTSCFMIPETYEFIGELAGEARARGIEVLIETHAHFRQQIEIARRVDRVYDFALPALVLHALYRADAEPLRTWLRQCPRNAVTVLDTHDGIGVADAGPVGTPEPGLLPPEAIEAVAEEIHRRSRGESRLASGAAARNVDFDQVNCTYYDALGGDDRDYLVARAIQFFAPGVPQVYYVGLLAGANDVALLRRTGEGRDINRRYYTYAELGRALERPVVRRLGELIRLRNSLRAFEGELEVAEAPGHRLALTWRKDAEWATLDVDLRARRGAVRAGGPEGAIAEWTP